MSWRNNGFVEIIERLHECVVAIGNLLQHPLLFMFRLNWGWQFFITGQGKLTNHHNVALFFASLGIPEPGLNAWLVGGVECIGGLFLLIGFASRPAALLLTANMIVAYLAVADFRAAVFGIFKDPVPFLSSDPFFFLLTALLILCFGPGLISVDSIIAKILDKRHEAVRR
jgi:putative oxidoreductase